MCAGGKKETDAHRHKEDMLYFCVNKHNPDQKTEIILKIKKQKLNIQIKN